MLDQQQIDRVIDQDLYGSDGDRIGRIKQIYSDDQNGQPAWVTVSTGLFGTKETFVPLAGADFSADGLTVPYTKDFIKDAPNVDADGHLSVDEERQLYAHYSRDDYDIGTNGRSGYDSDVDGRSDFDAVGTAERSRAGGRADEPLAGRAEGQDVSGPNTDDAMTVSEERLDVGTERREAGRARLRKYVVTENVTTTVPVEREEVRLEREPITDANVDPALSGPAISEEEHEVVLHEERPTVEKEAVPVERVRLGKETVTDSQTVGDEVRKERVELDDGHQT